MIVNADNSIDQDESSLSFAQLGLLVGSYTFWEKDRKDLPGRLEQLMLWTLHLPPAIIGAVRCYPQLGISASGFAHIYDILLKEEKPASLSETQKADKAKLADILPLLRNPSLSTQQDIQKTHAYDHFKPYIKKFSKYVQYLSPDKEPGRLRHRAMGPRKYIWLSPEDSKWWVTAITGTLAHYLGLIRENKLTPLKVERLDEWLECSIFVPLDLRQPLSPPVDPKDKEQVRGDDELAKKVKDAATQMSGEEIRHLYLSWDLVAFDFWDDDWRQALVHRTILALWTTWPDDIAWAPPRPKGFSPAEVSTEKATFLLTHLLQHARRYFLRVKDDHHLPLKRLVFEKGSVRQVHLPPMFFFADPATRKATIEDYIKNDDAHFLIRHCIGFDDHSKDILAWSTLEGSMATVRGEITRTGSYKARYLLFPIRGTNERRKEIGSDLDYIVDVLTYLEYTIGLEAEDIYNKIQDIESKREVDSDTVNTLDYITRKLANVVSTLPGEALERGAEDFAELQLLLGRAQYALEKMKGEADLIEKQYDYLVNRSDDYLRQSMFITRVKGQLSVAAAITGSYPYRYLRAPMKYLPMYTGHLANSIDRIRALLTLLSTAINNDEIKRHAFFNRRVQEFVTILALAAILVALPTFFPNVNAQAIFNLFHQLAAYNANTGKIALAILIVSVLTFLVWAGYRILRYIVDYDRPRSERHRFRESVREFWSLADNATYMYNDIDRVEKGQPSLSPALHRPPSETFKTRWNEEHGADNIDRDATENLQKLWPYLEKISQAFSKEKVVVDNKRQALKDMTAQVRLMSRLIHIFVLRPDYVPLPRTLCILRYKSLQFLEEYTISDNDFRNSLTLIKGYNSHMVNVLANWLSEEDNKNWMKSSSIEEVAQALEKAGVTTPSPLPPPLAMTAVERQKVVADWQDAVKGWRENAMKNWQGKLAEKSKVASPMNKKKWFRWR